MNKILMITILAILALSLNACVPDYKSGNITTNTDSYNDNSIDNSIRDSNVTYTDTQEMILSDGYVPETEGVCESGFFWCSIEERCLPTIDGATCPLAHTEEEEAEVQEIFDNN